jgi:hypothetical protein
MEVWIVSNLSAIPPRQRLEFLRQSIRLRHLGAVN